MTSDFKKLHNMIDNQTNLSDFLRMPSDIDKQSLKTLTDFREKIVQTDRVKNHIDEGIRTFTDRAFGDSRRFQFADFLKELLPLIDAKMQELHSQGETDSRLIFTENFTKPLQTISVSQANGLDDVLWAGSVEHYKGQLPDKPLQGWYKHGSTDHIILGMGETALDGQRFPRAIYYASDALRLTAAFRHRQAEQENEEAYQARLLEDQKRRDFESSEIGKALALQKRIERLKAQGKLPPEYIETST